MLKQLRIVSFFFALLLVSTQANAQWSTDSVSFETPVPTIVIDTTGNNLWQIGKPQKTYFDSAHSGINAILTDTLNDYPPNDTSSFIYVIRNPYTQTCLTCMEFWHKYDMDTLADQGIIDASYDGGNSWVLVSDTFFINRPGDHFSWDYDYHASNGKYTPHPLFTSGKSDGWIKSRFCWQWFLPVSGDTIIVIPDSLMIRFTFISDSIDTNKEGWMIDDIVSAAAGWELCSAINEPSINEKITVYPNPFSTETIITTVDFFSNATLNVFNSLGQKVKQVNNIYGQSWNLERDFLPGGLYFLQLTQENKILETVKVMVTDY